MWSSSWQQIISVEVLMVVDDGFIVVVLGIKDGVGIGLIVGSVTIYFVSSQTGQYKWYIESNGIKPHAL